MKPKKNGVIYKGVFTPVWGGGLNHNKSPRFLKSGGIENISVAILAENHYVSVVTEEQFNMAKIYRIRKLTPRECFRLMGVSESDIDKIQAYPFHELLKYPSYSREEKLAGMTEAEKRRLMKDKISESQQYKLAGNSIVVNVLEAIFTQMFRADSDTLF